MFNNLLRRQIGSRWPTVDHIAGRSDIIFAALAGYENEEVALNTGMILREMLRHEQLCSILLHSDQYVIYVIVSWPSKKYPVQVLQISSLYRNDDIWHFLWCVCESQGDSYQTQVNGSRISWQKLWSCKLVFSHIMIYTEWLTVSFLIKFFSSFTTLILSENYVTKRQSLKLLGEILLDRANFNVMTRYISNEANLKMMMNLLRDKSKNIQFEAFHVFKVSLLVAIKLIN